MNLIKYRFSLICIIGLAIIASCSKMDDNYKEFVKGGEIVYLGKADSVQTFSGKNRIKVTWLLLSDPKINKSVIYWNEKQDSLVVPIERSSGIDTVSVFLENMAEQTYNFEIYNYDSSGHSSVKQEAIGTVYGDNYASSLTNRSFAEATYKVADKSALINWYGAATEAVIVEIVFTDTDGKERTIKESRSVAPVNPINPYTFPVETVLSKYKKGTTFKYRTGYLPKAMAIDTFYTDYKTVELQFPSTAEINIALSKNVEKSSDSSSGRAANITDGDRSTFWQPLSNDRSDLNIWAVIDLEDSETFDHVGLYWTKANDKIESYDILYSDDNTNWQVAYHKDSPVPSEESVDFPEVTGRYVKLSINLSSSTNVTLGELEVYDK
ncbi:MAG TPA: DUF4998 domain-containing protein [Pelobium sp.]|nr:DUF4998 domain-containing protein [Pelobium sp.]